MTTRSIQLWHKKHKDGHSVLVLESDVIWHGRIAATNNNAVWLDDGYMKTADYTFTRLALK